MAYHVEISAEAECDLEYIYGSINGENSLAAAAWFNGLHIAIRSLSEMPLRCPIVQEDSSLRHLLYGTKPHVYRVLYTVSEVRERVYVIGIRHGACTHFPQDEIERES